MTTRGHTPPPEESPDAALDFPLAKPARVSAGRVLAVVLVALVVFGATFVLAYLPRRAARAELVAAAAERAAALPRVVVARPRLVAGDRTLTLPGSVQPLEEAVIYARASGYVRRWLVDIGTHVKEGQLLAEIDTPELDQELAQARAALAQARANVLQAEASRHLASSRLARTGKLVDAGLSPVQDLEQTQAESAVGDADLEVAQANVVAQQANIRRLGDLEAFSRVTAPFAGTITARSIDRGSLVTAGNVATPLFKLASTDTVRVFVQVPQAAATSIVSNAPATLSLREYPAEAFHGVVARNAGALDAATRTLATEIRVPNPDGRLLAGMYAEVHLELPSARRVFEVPATALLNDAAGLRLTVVRSDGTVHLAPVVIERDLGATIEIASGLEGGERIVQVASPDLAEGARVEPVLAAPASAAPTPPAAPPVASAAPPAAGTPRAPASAR